MAEETEMIQPKPVAGSVLLEPVLQRAEWAENVEKRSGIIIPPPDNKHSFEGVPNQGIVFSLPDGYDGPLQVGMRVLFDDKNPHGFKHDGKPIIRIKLENILAEVTI